jgi:hypothetical protein
MDRSGAGVAASEGVVRNLRRVGEDITVCETGPTVGEMAGVIHEEDPPHTFRITSSFSSTGGTFWRKFRYESVHLPSDEPAKDCIPRPPPGCTRW